MRSVVSAFRGQRQRQHETKTPVPYAPRHFSYASGGMLAPSGAEAQMKAVGGNATLFAAADALATAEAAAEWHLYRPISPGAPAGTERTLVTAHPAIDLWSQPNPFYSRPHLVKTISQHMTLVGEAFLLVVKIGNLPIELWPVRPDRMEHVPHPEKYLQGWIYTGPGGERVPLGTDQVIHLIQTPCPWDPYRGMGAVQAILTDLYGSAAAAEWHRNFFRNSARPDIVIEIPETLSDTEWEEFNERWAAAHRGVSNAWRAATLEKGAKVATVGYSAHDMQFVELRHASDEQVRTALRMPTTLLGQGENLNRATAEAHLYMFMSRMVVPRLSGVRDDGLNFRLLPMYGPTGTGVEFDYVNPVPEDAEAADRKRLSQAQAFEIYLRAGVAAEDAAQVVGLPRMRVAIRPASAPAPAPATPEPPEALALGHTSNGHGGPLAFGRQPHRHALPRAAADGDSEEGEPDLSGVRTDLDEALARLQRDFRAVDEVWFAALAEQVRDAVDAGDRAALGSLAVDSDAAAEVLRTALAAMEATAARRAADEVAAAGVEAEPGEPEEEEEGLSEAAAALVAAWLAAQAAREALRLWLPAAVGAEVAAGVALFLQALKHAARWAFLAWLLHRAINRGRYRTFRVAVEVRPGGHPVAYEINDVNRCGPCGLYDGHVFASLDAALAVYGAGGYPLCEGRERCRGTYYMVWD